MSRCNYFLGHYRRQSTYSHLIERCVFPCIKHAEHFLCCETKDAKQKNYPALCKKGVMCTHANTNSGAGCSQHRRQHAAHSNRNAQRKAGRRSKAKSSALWQNTRSALANILRADVCEFASVVQERGIGANGRVLRTEGSKVRVAADKVRAVEPVCRFFVKCLRLAQVAVSIRVLGNPDGSAGPAGYWVLADILCINSIRDNVLQKNLHFSALIDVRLEARNVIIPVHRQEIPSAVLLLVAGADEL